MYSKYLRNFIWMWLCTILMSTVCMYVCMHACMYVQYVCMYTWMVEDPLGYWYVCMYVCMYVRNTRFMCVYCSVMFSPMLPPPPPPLITCFGSVGAAWNVCMGGRQWPKPATESWCSSGRTRGPGWGGTEGAGTSRTRPSSPSSRNKSRYLPLHSPKW